MIETSAGQICCLSRYTLSKFIRKSSVSGDQDGRSRRALSTVVMFPWYKILKFRKIILSVLKIFPLKIFSKIVCIRRTARRLVPSCHVFHGHDLLIHCSKYKPDMSAVSPDIPTQFFFENRLYHEIIWTQVLVVASLPWACPPDTWF